MPRSVPIALALALAASAAPAEVSVLTDVPSYLWYHGCGPTAAGMIVGYWDAKGLDDLIPGRNDWAANQTAIQAMIASAGHVRDYVPTPDRTATTADPYHDDDCVADFMRASRDPLDYGGSFENLQQVGIVQYVASCGYEGAAASYLFFGGLEGVFFDEIDAGRPVELFVDSNADGTADHYVVAVGYDDTPGAEQYACHNTYDHALHWYDFARTEVGRPYGIKSGTLVTLPAPWPGDANWDGAVDVFDLAILGNHFHMPGPWEFRDGDFNADGAVDVFDLAVLGNSYGHVATGGVVPEPGVLAIVAVTWLAVLRPRRRV